MALVETQARADDLVHPLMHLGIENLDDRLADGDGMRHPDRLAEQADQAAADIGLAGAGRAVNHDRPAGVERDSELVEQAVVQYHSLESGLHILGGNAAMVNGLGEEQFAVALHRVGRRADVAAARQRILRRAATALGEAVAQATASAGLAEHLDPPLLAQEAQQLVEHRPGQRQALHQPAAIQTAGVVQVFAQQIDQ
ncbi:hypothetical protein D3C78_892650 [compost metagenome]